MFLLLISILLNNVLTPLSSLYTLPFNSSFLLQSNTALYIKSLLSLNLAELKVNIPLSISTNNLYPSLNSILFINDTPVLLLK